MSIEISPELEAALAGQARRAGLSVQAYVEGILTKAIRRPAGLTREDLERIAAENDTPERRADRAAAIDQIRELRRGLTLGPGLTIRDLIDDGRRF